MTTTNSKFLAVLMIILGLAIVVFGVISWVNPDLNGKLNTLVPISLGIIAYGLCSIVGGCMGIRARISTLVFYIPFIIAASIFIGIIAFKIVF